MKDQTPIDSRSAPVPAIPPAKVTVCLLNYKRPANLRRILQALRRQIPKVAISVWDNYGEQQEWDADLVVRSSTNGGTGSRWFLATQATTEFVPVMDNALSRRGH